VLACRQAVLWHDVMPHLWSKTEFGEDARHGGAAHGSVDGRPPVEVGGPDDDLAEAVAGQGMRGIRKGVAQPAHGDAGVAGERLQQ